MLEILNVDDRFLRPIIKKAMSRGILELETNKYSADGTVKRDFRRDRFIMNRLRCETLARTSLSVPSEKETSILRVILVN